MNLIILRILENPQMGFFIDFYQKKTKIHTSTATHPPIDQHRALPVVFSDRAICMRVRSWSNTDWANDS